MSNQTTNLKLIKPIPGSTNWGQVINNNFDKIDSYYRDLKNNIEYYSKTLGSMNYVFFEPEAEWVIIGYDFYNQGVSRFPVKDIIDNSGKINNKYIKTTAITTGTLQIIDEVCYFYPSRSYNADATINNSNEATNSIIVFEVFRGCYILNNYDPPTNLFVQSLPWEKTWERGQIMVKTLIQTQGVANEYDYVPFTQSLGGFYEPTQIHDSTALRFKKVMYHEAPNNIDIRFPTGFINATHFECLFSDEKVTFNSNTNEYKINLTSSLMNSEITDYSQIEVLFLYLTNETNTNQLHYQKILLDYSIVKEVAGPNTNFYFLYIRPGIVLDEGTSKKLKLRITSYKKVHKLVFNTYYEEVETQN